VYYKKKLEMQTTNSSQECDGIQGNTHQRSYDVTSDKNDLLLTFCLDDEVSNHRKNRKIFLFGINDYIYFVF
jgi:hypothetical protein